MNERLPDTPARMAQNNRILPAAGRVSLLPSPPLLPVLSLWPAPYLTGQRKTGGKQAVRREPSLFRDALFVIRRDQCYHIIAESYFYKTEPYYTILAYENQGKPVKPSSSSVLDAYVIPVCLEKAKLAGIPVCEYGISQAYVPLPAILYGLNYFATSSEYTIVNDTEVARNVIRHITNNGKYPFCFQKFPEAAEVRSCIAVFGKTLDTCSTVGSYAERIYDLFGIPLMKMVFVKTGNDYLLSALTPTRYTQLSEGERTLLSAYLTSQEFL